MSNVTWSPYQKSVFEFAESGSGNAIVEAVAGSGKTTTIVETLRRIEFQYPSTLFLAFNKSIAEELKSRGVNARTFHSLTYGPVTKYLNARQVDANKTRKIMNEVLSFSDVKLYGSFVSRLVGLAKQMGIGCLVDDTEDQWYAIIEHQDLSLESENAEITKAVELSRNIFMAGNESSYDPDFDDLLYLAVKEGISLPKFDFIFVDEAQDTNAIQRAILRKAMAEGARMIAVGDPAQAIYGFRGSDSNSLNMIAEEFKCVRLPLTVSYRCPQKVIEHAQKWVDHIQTFEGAPEGEVIKMKEWKTSDISKGDMVVCRTVKPIIALAYKMMKNKGGVAPHVLGRDIGVGMKALIRKMNAADLEGLVLKLDAWRAREVEQALVRIQESKIQAIEDKYDAIICLVEEMEEDNRTIDDLLKTIDDLFTDKANSAMLCTIHKSKGLENKKVFWINSKKMPPPWAKLEWQIEQELNLCYVATTRAKETLVLIEEEGLRNEIHC